jgi:hypothetical protein
MTRALRGFFRCVLMFDPWRGYMAPFSAHALPFLRMLHVFQLMTARLESPIFLGCAAVSTINEN